MSAKRFRTTVTGSYPRPQQPGDTLKKPTLTREQADEIIRWAVQDQVAAGLDIVTDVRGASRIRASTWRTIGTLRATRRHRMSK